MTASDKREYHSLNVGFHVNDRLEDVQTNRRSNSRKYIISLLIPGFGAEQTHETFIYKRFSVLTQVWGLKNMTQSFKKTDGFYTSDKNILLTLMYADCVPIFFYAPTSGFIGVAHAGWKGTVGEIAPKMVSALQSEGVSANEILVVIGPSICQNCYVVDNKVIDNVQKLLEEYDEKPYNLISEGQYQLDLKQLNMLFYWKKLAYQKIILKYQPIVQAVMTISFFRIDVIKAIQVV